MKRVMAPVFINNLEVNMARLPYPDLDHTEIQPLVNRIVTERGKMLNLYHMLLHSPPVAEGWLAFLTAIRQKCGLDAKLREVVILRIAVVNQAEYEFQSHAPIALDEGVTHAQLDALRKGDFSLFSEVEKAALEYSDSMTRDIDVPEEQFEAISCHLSDQEMVELTAAIAAYNLVSRFLEALKVDHDE